MDIREVIDFIEFLEENPEISPRYFAVKEQILSTRPDLNAIENTQGLNFEELLDSDILFFASGPFLKYDTSYRSYMWDTAGQLEDSLVASGRVFGVDSEGNRVIIRRRLGNQADQNVYLADLISHDGSDQSEVVVKWVDPLDDYPEREGENWIRFREEGANTPWFSTDFRVLEYKVFVIELLEPITRDEDLYEFGTQILEQLQILHRYACHSDIKPDNILKRRESDGSFTYFLIDLAHIANQPLYYGFSRPAFTPNFASQVQFRDQVITPKYDLIEFAFVLNWLTFDDSRPFGKFMTTMMNAKRSQMGLPEVDNWWMLEKPNNSTIYRFWVRAMSTPETEVTPRVYEDLFQVLVDLRRSVY